jgi:mannosyltransferase OCH1-like enzyme
MIKIIHQVWIGPNAIPPEYSMFCRDIKTRHTNYQYKFWDNTLVKQEFGNDAVYKIMLSQKLPYALIVDYLRMMIIYKYGGWYVDIDSECISTLDDIKLPTDITAIFGRYDKDIVENSIFYSVPKNPLLLELANVYSNITLDEFLLFNYRNICTNIIQSTPTQILGQRYFYAYLKTNALVFHSKFMHSFRDSDS